MAFDPSLLTSLENLETVGLYAALTHAYHFARIASRYLPFARINTDDAVRSRLYPFLAALRKNEGRSLPLGAAGFCWGGYWCFQLASDPEGVDVDGKRLALVDAVYTAHPSNMRVPEDVEAVSLPMSVAAGEIDARFPKDKVEVTREIWERKTREEGRKHELVWYEGCHHGWAIRGKKDDPVEGRKGLEAEEQALRWFGARFADVRAKNVAA